MAVSMNMTFFRAWLSAFPFLHSLYLANYVISEYLVVTFDLNMKYSCFLWFLLLLLLLFVAAHVHAEPTKITCSDGFSFNNSTRECEDIDECGDEALSDCRGASRCINYPGHYACLCYYHFQRRIDDDGYDTCIDTILLKQKFNMSFSTDLEDRSSRRFKDTSDIVLNIYRDGFSGGRVISFSGSNVVALFELYEYEVANIYHAQELYNDSLPNWTTVLPGIEAQPPETAPSMCTFVTQPSTKHFGWELHFPNSLPNKLVASGETCRDSGSTATIECRESFGYDGYYDYNTYLEFPCNINITEIYQKIIDSELNSSLVETFMGEIRALSSGFTADSTEEIKDAVAILHWLATEIRRDQIMITGNTMTYMIWISNDLHNVLVNTSESEVILKKEEKVKLLESVETFASRLSLEYSELEIRTDFVKFKAKPLVVINEYNYNGNYENNEPSKFVDYHYFNGNGENNRTYLREYTPYGEDVEVEDTNITKIYFDETPEGREDKNSPQLDAKIPPSVFQNVNFDGDTMGAIALLFLYTDDLLFPSDLPSNMEIRQVFGLQISNVTLKDLEEPIILSFPPSPRTEKQKRDFRAERCAYFNIPLGDWKFDGCEAVEGVHPIKCECTHTTNFAVIVQTYSLPSDLALGIVGYIGLSLSILGLLMMFVIYLTFKQLRTNQMNQIHLNLAICLLVGYITFLVGVERPRAYVPCMAVGAILQFSFLAAWGWMLSESITIYRKFFRIFKKMESNFVWKVAAVVYSSSLLATGITITLARVLGDDEMFADWEISSDNDPNFYPSYYVSDRLCWLHDYSLILGFLAPVTLILCANFVVYCLVIRKLTKKSKISSSKNSSRSLRTDAFRVFTLSLLLGVTWTLAVPLTITDDVTVNLIFGWAFSIANAFQGFFIFLMFCVRREEVRVLWIAQIRFMIRKQPDSVTPSTGISSADQYTAHHTDEGSQPQTTTYHL